MGMKLEINNRKNLENTIQWFAEEFVDQKDVGLILKISIRNGSIIDRHHTRRRIKDLISKYKDRKCRRSRRGKNVWL